MWERIPLIFDGLLLGGTKSGFETCAICNHCIAMKQSAVKRRDRQTIDRVRALQRIHLKQQQVERQHCDNYIHLAKHEYNDLTVGSESEKYIAISEMNAS